MDQDMTSKHTVSADLDQATPSPAKSAISDGPSPETAATAITGRAAFVVDTSAAGIVVRTAFVGENGQVIELPAVFPDLGYALQQIDHLRQIVIDRFAQAAQVGVQVMAAQGQASSPASADADRVGAGNEAQAAVAGSGSTHVAA